MKSKSFIWRPLLNCNFISNKTLFSKYWLISLVGWKIRIQIYYNITFKLMPRLNKPFFSNMPEVNMKSMYITTVLNMIFVNKVITQLSPQILKQQLHASLLYISYSHWQSLQYFLCTTVRLVCYWTLDVPQIVVTLFLLVSMHFNEYFYQWKSRLGETVTKKLTYNYKSVTHVDAEWQAGKLDFLS